MRDPRHVCHQLWGAGWGLDEGDYHKGLARPMSSAAGGMGAAGVEARKGLRIVSDDAIPEGNTR